MAVASVAEYSPDLESIFIVLPRADQLGIPFIDIHMRTKNTISTATVLRHATQLSLPSTINVASGHDSSLVTWSTICQSSSCALPQRISCYGLLNSSICNRTQHISDTSLFTDHYIHLLNVRILFVSTGADSCFDIPMKRVHKAIG